MGCALSHNTVYPRLTRTHTVLAGRKNAHTSSKTLKIHKVFPAAFSSSGRLSASAKLLAPDSDGFSCDFWLLRRRCVVTHQDEKARPTSRTPSKAQRSGFVRKKEEGESIMEFSPQGGNGMTQTSSDASGVCALVNRGYYILIIPKNQGFGVSDGGEYRARHTRRWRRRATANASRRSRRR